MVEGSISPRMREVISRFSESGQSVREFCKVQSISISQYHYWRRKFGFNFRKSKKRAASAPGKGFVRVKLEERAPSVGFNGPSCYELQLPGGRLLRIPPRFEFSSLKALLNLLSS